MQGYRIFFAAPNGTDVIRSSFVLTPDGVELMPDSYVGKVFPAVQAIARNIPILSGIDELYELANIRNDAQTGANNSLTAYPANMQKTLGRSNGAPAVQIAKSTDNNLVTTQLETAGRSLGGVEKLYLTMNNKTNNLVNFIIFDAYNICAQKEGMIPLPEAVEVSGTFRDQTLNILHLVPLGSPFKLQGLHISSSTGAIMSSQGLKLLRGSMTNRTEEEDIVLSDSVRPDTFQTKIVEIPSFSALVDPFTGLLVPIAAGEQVTFTWTIQSVNQSFNMQRRPG